MKIKPGEKGIEEGAQQLLEIQTLLTLNNFKKPSALIVFTGTHITLKHNDGIYVIPVGYLRP